MNNPDDSDDGGRLPPPRLQCIPVTEAPIVLVFRRGPSDWFHLLRWHLDSGALEHGVWVRKKLFPGRCDVSSDGELLSFYLSGNIDGGYRVFAGVSRSPWLHPLVSWEEKDTWGRGYSFATGTRSFAFGDPLEHCVDGQTLIMQINDSVSFINERRRGWTEAPDCQPQTAGDVWDAKRELILQRSSPASTGALRLISKPGSREINYPDYQLVSSNGESVQLMNAVWADWDYRGRLLQATQEGQLLMSKLEGDCWNELQRHDLSHLRPTPSSAPTWAHSLDAARPDSSP